MAQDSSLSSLDYMDTTAVSEGAEEEVNQFVLVGQKLKDSKDLYKALEDLDLEVIYSDTGIDNNLLQTSMAYVVDNFEGSIFSTLIKHKKKIFGPTAIIEHASRKFIPRNVRPIYNLSMEKIVICFNGFKDKNELDNLATLVHQMSGIIRRDMVAGVTHLVSTGTEGDKYKLAVGKGVPIMSPKWILKCWEMKDRPFFRARELPNSLYRLSLFINATLTFYGFSKEDLKQMEEATTANGGATVKTGCGPATHFVVNERSIKSLPYDLDYSMHIVKSEWFWACIQMEARANENLYLFDLNSLTPGSQSGRRTPNTPLSNGSSRITNKRKRLRENLAHLASEGDLDLPACKRTSLDVSSRNNSLNDILLDMSLPAIDDVATEPLVMARSTSSLKEPKLSARQQTIMELYQTETNYISILETILKVFKEGIENREQPGGAILNGQEVKAIFGGVPPIYRLHLIIKDKLMRIISNWDEDLSVGEVYLQHGEDILKLYPNFINYYEGIKDTICQCEKNKPRFHAFLKVCQSRAECGRQALTDLFIRLVQRVPSVGLLLKDIQKRTDESNRDHRLLGTAADYLNAVMAQINEDKRRTEGHQAVLGLVNEIEGGPASLASSLRVLVTRLDVIEVSGNLSLKGTSLTLFVFTDSIEICKRRSHHPSHRNSSVSINASMMSKSKKPFKHLAYIEFHCIKRIVEICDVNDPYTVFALVVKLHDKEDEKLFAFAVANSNPPTYPGSNQAPQQSEDLLTFLSKIICCHLCRPNHEKLVAAVESHELNLDLSTLNGKNTFSKAASRIGKKVSRVFSMSKTPLKRTISSITQLVSPMRKDASTATIQNPPSASKNIENEQYSDIVDKVSIGTPSLQRRRETLASITTIDNIEHVQLRNQQKNLSDGTFLTPLPIRGRAARTILSQVLPINLSRDFPSMQSLNFDSPTPGSSTPGRGNR